jgi:ubiquinone/menaquinone biosynthesis C-methylase UbiE
MPGMSTMRDQINRPEWVKQQYANDGNLNARIALHKRFGTSQIPWSRWVLDHVAEELDQQFGPAESGAFRLLELGCGPGSTWADSPYHRAASWQPLLSDLSPGMVFSARQNLARAGVQADLLVANAERIPAVDASFHAVMANHMLYHVPDRTRAFQEIRRVLRPGGVLFAATNGDGHMQELWDLQSRFDPTQVQEDPSPRKFSLESGARELENHFREVRVVHKDNQLIVTETEPLVAYMLSGMHAAVAAEKQEALRAFVESEFAERGVVRITPVSGMLIAHD